GRDSGDTDGSATGPSGPGPPAPPGPPLPERPDPAERRGARDEMDPPDHPRPGLPSAPPIRRVPPEQSRALPPGPLSASPGDERGGTDPTRGNRPLGPLPAAHSGRGCLIQREGTGRSVRYRLTPRGEDAAFVLLALLRYGLTHHVGPQPLEPP